MKQFFFRFLLKKITSYSYIINIFRWALTVSFRKYIILWEYFWYFEWKKQKTSQNSPISTIFFIIKISKIEFSQKGLLKIFTLNWFLILQYTLILGIYSKGLTDSVQPVHPLRINVRITTSNPYQNKGHVLELQ